MRSLERLAAYAGMLACMVGVAMVGCKTIPDPAAPSVVERKPDAGPRDASPDASDAGRLASLPFNTALIHVDQDFTAEEQAHIRNAATAWNLFSMGGCQLATAPLTDWDEDNHRIIKVESKDNPLVAMVDGQHKGARVLAFTMVPSHGGWASRLIYIISDRITPDQFHWIVVHEMGHFLGLNDLEEGGHIMSGMGRFEGDWFTDADYAECKDAKVCR